MPTPKMPQTGCDFAPLCLEKAGWEEPIYVSSVLPPNIETQRQAPLTEATLPAQAAPVKSKKKGKGKGGGKAKSTATTPAPPTNWFALPDPGEALCSFLDRPEAFITDWANDDQTDKLHTDFLYLTPILLTILRDSLCPWDQISKSSHRILSPPSKTLQTGMPWQLMASPSARDWHTTTRKKAGAACPSLHVNGMDFRPALPSATTYQSQKTTSSPESQPNSWMEVRLKTGYRPSTKILAVLEMMIMSLHTTGSKLPSLQTH